MDAGGDVNLPSGGWLPLFAAISKDFIAAVRVMLDDPRLDLTVKYDGDSAIKWSRNNGMHELSAVLAAEVR